MVCSIAHRSQGSSPHKRTKICLTPFILCLIISSRCSLTRNERMNLGFHLFDLSEVSVIPRSPHSNANTVAIIVRPLSPISVMSFTKPSLNDCRLLADNSLGIITVAASIISESFRTFSSNRLEPGLRPSGITSLNFRNAIILLLQHPKFVQLGRHTPSPRTREHFGKHCLTGFRYRMIYILCFSANSFNLTLRFKRLTGPTS